MDEEKLKDMITQIDFVVAENILSAEIGMPVRLDVEITTRNTVAIESKDSYHEHCGVMSGSYDSLKIESFGGAISQDEQYFFFPAHWAYSHKKGGSNGSDLMDLMWDFQKHIWIKR